MSPVWSISGANTDTLTFNKTYTGMNSSFKDIPFILDFTVSGASDCELETSGFIISNISTYSEDYQQPRFIALDTPTYGFSPDGYVPAVYRNTAALAPLLNQRFRIAAGRYRLNLEGASNQTSYSSQGTMTLKARSTSPAKFFTGTDTQGFWGAGTNKRIAPAGNAGQNAFSVTWSPATTATVLQFKSMYPQGTHDVTLVFGGSYSAATEALGWSYNDKYSQWSRDISGNTSNVTMPAGQAVVYWYSSILPATITIIS